MRILIAHNHYQQFGGEDAVVETEYALLKGFQEDVRLYKRSNSEITSYSFFQKINFVLNLSWSCSSYRQMKKILREFRPQVVHFHNTFFMLSPSVYAACREENVPVVQSLHNFRLRCANGLFFRNNRVCEDCLKGSLWNGVRHRCYKNSRLITTLVVRILEEHWKRGTWTNMVDYYIAVTEFSRQKMIQAGIAPEKIVVKPNCVRWQFAPSPRGGEYALYAGRLSPEKGVRLLLEAWRTLANIPLKILGSGPLMEELKNFVKNNGMKHVEFLGFVSGERYTQRLNGAKFVVVPSLCYENFPRIIVEAYACGIPVLASRLGAMQDLVRDFQTGRLFEPGNADDLIEKACWLADHEVELDQMGQRARQEYEQKYSAPQNYDFLMAIYKKAVEGRRISTSLRPRKESFS